MPRTARFRLDGAPFHILQRGHNKQPCFFAPGDYELYLGLLAEYAPACGCRVHAYVLMTNHVHLLLTPGDAWGFTRLMRHVNQHYVQYVNRTHARCGSTWQGRFWSSAVQTDQYLFACHRYIELNPVRAGMVLTPREYPWSSHGHNAFGRGSVVISPHENYVALGETEGARRLAYRRMFGELTADELCRMREAIRGGRPIGSEQFLDDMERRLGIRVRRGKPGPRRKDGGCGELRGPGTEPQLNARES